MANRNIAERLVDALFLPDGCRAKRPVHALGIGATGYFEASPVAGDYCVAEHFQGTRIPVTVRFSNGSGSVIRHDGWSDVRGMATRFHLQENDPTDLIAMTLPEFFAPTPETTLDFFKAAKPAPCKAESPWQKIVDMLKLTPPVRDPYPGQTTSPDAGAIRFADENRFAQLAVLDAANIGAPASYVRASYHAVHTFIIEAPDGTRRWVRFTWQPIAGVQNIDPDPEAKCSYVDRNYLDEELEKRLKAGTAQFSLMMTIGDTGDDFNDPTKPWPPHRVRIMMGMLTLDAVPQNQAANCEDLSFNPCRLTRGIEPSDDPVLKVRQEAYELSSRSRAQYRAQYLAQGGVPCPVHGPAGEAKPNKPGCFARFVDSLPKQKWFNFLAAYVVVPLWVGKSDQPKLPGGPRPSVQPSENVQRMMNLIMPLKDKSPLGRAKAVQAVAQNVDEIFAGLDNVGTVHFARFLLIDGNLCMISVYDGDFTNYIRDFIMTIGSVFDEIMTLVEGGEDLKPTAEHVDAFIDWVHKHDLFQAPDFPTDLFALRDAEKGLPPDGPPHNIRSLPRDLILQLHANPNISLGGGYRAYPGFSVAQVRRGLGVGW